MPERKIVPWSRTYLSCRVVSGRDSLTGALGCAVPPTASLISVPATWSPLLTAIGQGKLPTSAAGGNQEGGGWTNERPRALLLPRALELAEMLVHDRLDLVEIARADRRGRAHGDPYPPLWGGGRAQRPVAP